MRVLELFSGTGTFAAEARRRGHEVFTVDLHQESDLRVDLLTVSGAELLEAAGWDGVDVLWASPPCTGFSVAVIGKCWRKLPDGSYEAKSDSARESLALLEATFGLIRELKPLVWYLENPRGMARKMSVVEGYRRETVTYCQYGDFRMKPTDIWTSDPLWKPRVACRNGDPCHEASPRGSQTGTQRIRSSKRRAALPLELCVEVLNSAERVLLPAKTVF